MQIDFLDVRCDVVFGWYGNDNIAIQLIAADDEDPDVANEVMTVATSNASEVTEPGVVGLKTWSENEGVAEALIDGGIIEDDRLAREATGHVQIEYYALTDEAYQAFQAKWDAMSEGDA